MCGRVCGRDHQEVGLKSRPTLLRATPGAIAVLWRACWQEGHHANLLARVRPGSGVPGGHSTNGYGLCRCPSCDSRAIVVSAGHKSLPSLDEYR